MRLKHFPVQEDAEHCGAIVGIDRRLSGLCEGSLLVSETVAPFIAEKKLAAAVSHAAANINQVCRRINQTGRFYAADIAELKARQEEIWSLLKESQKQEL